MTIYKLTVLSLTLSVLSGCSALLGKPFGDNDDWRVWCKNDQMLGRKNCLVTSGPVTVAFIKENGSIYKSIGLGSDNHFPGSEFSLKIDNNEIITWKDRKAPISLYDKAVEQMRNGNVLMSRFYTWPREIERTNRVMLNGFKEAMDYAVSQVDNYHPVNR